MRRELFSRVISYIAGIAAGSLLMSTDFVFSACICFMIVYFCRKGFDIGKSCVVFAIAGIAMFTLFTISFEKGEINTYCGEKVFVHGHIVNASESSSGIMEYVCSVSQINENPMKFSPVPARIIFRDKAGQIPYDEYKGAVIRFSCLIEKPESSPNPGMFDYRRYLYSRGISVTGQNFRLESFKASSNLYHRMIKRIISKREQFLNSFTDKSLKTIMQSVVFGNSSALSEDIYYEFQMNGTAHVLAVSGLHIGVLYACFSYLKRRSGIKILTPVFLIFLFIYATCAMWAVSVTRAVFLIVLKLLAEYTDRPFDILTATSCAALLICTLNPYTFFSVGFQLSFLAVCILAFIPRALERFGIDRISGAFAIQILIAPYICYVFNYFSLSGFVANIPVIFLISIFVPAGIAYFVFYSFSGISSELAERCLSGIAELTVRVNGFFFVEGKSSADLTTPGLYVIVLFYLLLFFLTSENFTIDCLRRNKAAAMSKVAAIFLCSFIVWMQGNGFFFKYGSDEKAPQGVFNKADFVFADFKNSECMHVRFDKDIDILIDGGGGKYYNTGAEMIKPYLLKNGVSDVDFAVSSILDERHYLGLFQLSGCFDVKELIVWADAGDEIKITENQKITVLWPEKSDISDLKSPDNRRVIKIWKDGVTCIIYGGLDSRNESLFLEKYEGSDVLSCDIVKVSVPVCGKVSADRFFDVANPSVAVVSGGGLNLSICDEMIENIAEKDIMVYRTDLLGAVGIIADKENIRVCAQQKNTLLKHLPKN